MVTGWTFAHLVGILEEALQSHYIFPVNTFAIRGRRMIAKGAFGAQGGHGPVSPPHPHPPTPLSWPTTSTLRFGFFALQISAVPSIAEINTAE